MKIGTKALEALLQATRREQHINGKPQPQVSSTVLDCADNVLSTVNVVKDGKTSLSRFSFKLSDDTEPFSIPVPDIDRMLGVLKYHGDHVSLKYGDNKVVIKSKNKQTTLVGGFDAKSYANSQTTLSEAYKQAFTRALQIKDNVYILNDDSRSTISPFFVVTLPASELYDAVRCDGMNGQKLNRYAFDCKDGTLTVSVGDVFKGMTSSVLGDDYPSDDFSVTFEGGLENIFKHYSGDVKLSFLDFSDYKQGIKLIITFGNGDFVFQSGVLNV